MSISLRCFLAVLLAFAINVVHAQESRTPGVIKVAEYEQMKESNNASGNFQIVMDLENPIQENGRDQIQITSESTLRGGGGDECACIQPLDASFLIVPFSGGEAPEFRNDDGSSAEIELPFIFCLYGQDYTSCFINNNGNVSFGSAYSTFSASAFPSNQFTMVAPFWADVDTRNTESGLVHYRLTPTSLTVFWDQVGYFSSQADKLNTFQVIISNGEDALISGGANVSFCYGDMEWTTGSASGGVNGFGGTPATVGCNKGDGINFIQLGQFDHAGVDYDGPGGQADGVSWLDNLTFAIDACTASDQGNVPPLFPSLSLCETIYICQGSEITLQFLGPEVNQLISLEYTIPDGSGLTASETSNSGSTQLIITAGLGSTLGSYPFTVIATDNGTPALSTAVVFNIVIIDVPEEITILGTPAICSGESTFLSIPTGYTNIEWSNGAASNTVSVDQPGTYTVTASLGGCDTSGSIEVTLSQNPAPLISGETLICADALTTLTLTGAGQDQVEWSNGSDQLSIEVGPGNYLVEVINSLGCSGTDSHTVSAFPEAVLPIDFYECDLSASVDGNNLAGSWAVTSAAGPVVFSPETNQTTDVAINVSSFGSYTFVYTEAECEISQELSIDFLPVPAFSLNDTLVCLGAPVDLVPSGSHTEFFEWDWGTGEISSSITLVADSLLTEIAWSASNECGLSSGIVSLIAEPCQITIPNVFTPNGEGPNNFFVIENIDKYPGSTLKVFNRWGAEVYSSDSYRNGWSPRTDDVAEGTYFYILGWKLAQETKYFEGHLTILR